MVSEEDGRRPSDCLEEGPEQIVGEDEAVAEIARALRGALGDLHDRRALGPQATGELALENNAQTMRHQLAVEVGDGAAAEFEQLGDLHPRAQGKAKAERVTLDAGRVEGQLFADDGVGVAAS